jgi:hypothetical protein
MQHVVISKKMGLMVWTGFKWLRIGSNSQAFVKTIMNPEFRAIS